LVPSVNEIRQVRSAAVAGGAPAGGLAMPFVQLTVDTACPEVAVMLLATCFSTVVSLGEPQPAVTTAAARQRASGNLIVNLFGTLP
jgi:hypothetical protein